MESTAQRFPFESLTRNPIELLSILDTGQTAAHIESFTGRSNPRPQRASALQVGSLPSVRLSSIRNTVARRSAGGFRPAASILDEAECGLPVSAHRLLVDLNAQSDLIGAPEP